MWESIKEFFTTLGKLGWVLAVDWLAAAWGLVLEFTDVLGPQKYEPWFWAALVSIAVLGPLWAFHEVRVERDKLKSSRAELVPHFKNAEEVDDPGAIYERTGKIGETDHRLGVYNKGPATARDVEAVLLEVWRVDKAGPQVTSHLPRSLLWADHGLGSRNIHCGAEALYQFAYSEITDAYDLVLMGDYWGLEQIPVEPGDSWRYSFRVTAENAEPLFFRITLTCETARLCGRLELDDNAT